MGGRRQSPAADAVLAALASEVDRVMSRRGWRQSDVYLRSQGRVSGTSVSNALRARNCTIATLVELALALDCELTIQLVPRARQHPTNRTA